MASASATRITSSTVPRHGALHVDHRAARRGLEVLLARPAEAARQPAAVAARGAEAGEFALDDDDAQRWLGLLQIVGGPQPGVAGADDGRHRPRCRRAAAVVGRHAADIGIPEGDITVVLGLHFQDPFRGQVRVSVGAVVVGQQLRVAAGESELDIVADGKDCSSSA